MITPENGKTIKEFLLEGVPFLWNGHVQIKDLLGHAYTLSIFNLPAVPANSAVITKMIAHKGGRPIDQRTRKDADIKPDPHHQLDQKM